MKLLDKIKATRLAIEKIIFEDEIATGKKLEKKYFVILFFIFSLYFLINFYYFYNKSDYLEYFLSNNDYSQLTLREIIFNTDLSKPVFEMPIYNIILKIISNFLTLNPWLIFLLNIFISFFGLFGFYLLIAKTKNEKGALVGITALLSTPFFWQMTRKPSPEIITFTSLIWSYYYYIKMKNEEQYDSVTYFILFYSLGLLSDKFFVIYTLPCFSFLSFLFNTVYSNRVLYIFVPSVIISLIFYLRFLVIFIIKYSITNVSFNYFNWKEILNIYLDYFGFIPFLVSLPFFIWMVFSIYNVYPAKKEIYKWFLYPVIVYFLISVDKSILKFTIPAIIVGISVMSFGVIKNLFFYIFLILAVLVGFNFSSIKLKDTYLWGYDDPNFGNEKVLRNLLYALSDELKDFKNIKNVSVKFIHNNISSDNFNILKNKYSLNKINFIEPPIEILVFSCYVITDERFSYLKNFLEIFNYKGISILKNPNCEWILDPNYKPKDIRLNKLEISDFEILSTKKEEFSFGDVELSIGYLGYYGVDLYGVRLVLKDAIINTNYEYLISHFSSIEVKNAILNQYSVARIFETIKIEKANFIFLNNLIKFNRNFDSFDFSVYFHPEMKNNVLYFNILNLKIGFIQVGNFFSKALTFKIPLDKLPVKINFSKIRFGNELIKIS